MIPFHRPATLALLASGLLPLAAHAELRPAVLPDEICLVLSNGPFDADIAARLAGRGDFADILLQAEAACPDLAGGLIGATATIPAGSPPNRDTGGPGIPTPLASTPPQDTASIPVDEPAGPSEEDDEEEFGQDPGPGGTNPGDFEGEVSPPALTAEPSA